MIIIAQIGAPFGIQGYVKVFSYTNPFDKALYYQPWFIKAPHDYKQLNIENAKTQNNKLIVRFQDCNNRNDTNLYTNTTVYVPRDVLPALPEGEYYLNDLHGLTIYHNQDGSCLGSVEWVMETGANEVLVIWDPLRKKEHLIPFLLNYTIISIDLDKKLAYVNWDPEF